MTVRRVIDPEGDRRRTVNHAAHNARKADAAIAARDNAIRFAIANGATLRELEQATGIARATLARISKKPTA